MKRIYVTYRGDSSLTSRWWIADQDKSKLIHLGVCDIDRSFANLLISNLDADLTYLKIEDDEFKKLMKAEGYEQ